MQHTLTGKALIVGMGETGLSCARFLQRQGMTVAVTDSRTAPPALSRLSEILDDANIMAGGFDVQAFIHCDLLVVSPGVTLDTAEIIAARDAGVEIIGDIELFARYADAPYLAITGSNGKSTVTMMVTVMAQAAGLHVRTGGNIGTPALDLLSLDLSTKNKPALYVLELSSFQLETTSSLNAKAAVILNISADHLDRHGSLAAYRDLKLRVHTGNGVLVINRDAVEVQGYVADLAASSGLITGQASDQTSDKARSILTYSCEQAGDFNVIVADDGRKMLAHQQQALMAVSELAVPGMHNVSNALAAMALAFAAGIPVEAMCEGLRHFTGLAHRMQRVANVNDVQWINDSKGTNVGATVAALSGLEEPVVLIAGGQGKDAEFELLKEPMAAHGRAAVLMGEDAGQLAQALTNVVPISYVANMDEAVNEAAALAQPGDVVLLSPACASFDMFSGYEERGQAFVDAVQRLAS